MKALHRLPSWDLRRSYVHIMDDGQPRTFKVKFEGEGVVDNGGPYRECFNEFMNELFHYAEREDDAIEGENEEGSYLPLFLICPNGRNGQGLNQDKFIPNPSCNKLEM